MSGALLSPAMATEPVHFMRARLWRWGAVVALCAGAYIGALRRDEAARTQSAAAGNTGNTVTAAETTVVLERVFVRPDETSPLTPAEDTLKTKLEAELAQDAVTCRLTLRNHQIVDGRILAQTPRQITFREGYGYSGSIVSVYRRTDIAKIMPLAPAAETVSRADVLLCEEFPGYHFVKSGPYSVVTDAPYTEVERTLRSLADLRRQFKERFAPLIRDRDSGQNIQVIFFNTEEPFRAYARKVAPVLEGSAGFYSSADNRLVLLNQLGTAQYAKFQEHIEQRRRVLDSPDNHSDNQVLASAQLSTWSSEVASEARAMTDRLVRHEGAHQLFRACGIQCPYAIEPTWLTEGLAQYCEVPGIGDYHIVLAQRLAKVRDEGGCIPLKTLLNHRDRSGFFSLGETNVERAYAESWALTYFLMEGKYHDRFFQLIKHYQDIDDVGAAAAEQKADGELLLASYLKTDTATLEAQWQKFVDHL